MPQIKYISEPAEYFDMLTSDQILVMGINFVSDEIVEMRYQYKEETPLWPTAGFLLHFEEGIHVIGKESSSFRFRIVLFRFIEMPHFVDALNYISFLQCFLQFVPIGHPEIVTEGFTDIQQYEGLIKCKILPPRGLYIPVLPVKMNNKLLFTLCRESISGF
jgi:hypothetical protein